MKNVAQRHFSFFFFSDEILMNDFLFLEEGTVIDYIFPLYLYHYHCKLLIFERSIISFNYYFFFLYF